MYGHEGTVVIDVFNATNHANIDGYSCQFEDGAGMDEGVLERTPDTLLPTVPCGWRCQSDAGVDLRLDSCGLHCKSAAIV